MSGMESHTTALVVPEPIAIQTLAARAIDPAEIGVDAFLVSIEGSVGRPAKDELPPYLLSAYKASPALRATFIGSLRLLDDVSNPTDGVILQNSEVSAWCSASGPVSEVYRAGKRWKLVPRPEAYSLVPTGTIR
jgi:hypothetical protein